MLFRNPRLFAFLLIAIGGGVLGYYGEQYRRLPTYTDADIEQSVEANLALDLARMGPHLQPAGEGESGPHASQQHRHAYAVRRHRGHDGGFDVAPACLANQFRALDLGLRCGGIHVDHPRIRERPGRERTRGIQRLVGRHRAENQRARRGQHAGIGGELHALRRRVPAHRLSCRCLVEQQVESRELDACGCLAQVSREPLPHFAETQESDAQRRHVRNPCVTTSTSGSDYRPVSACAPPHPGTSHPASPPVRRRSACPC